MRYPDGRIYKGYWSKGDKKEGWESFDDGSIYHGEFNQNKVQGHGSFHNADGSIYIGSFENEKFEGKGLLELKDKTRYDGEF